MGGKGPRNNLVDTYKASVKPYLAILNDKITEKAQQPLESTHEEFFDSCIPRSYSHNPVS